MKLFLPILRWSSALYSQISRQLEVWLLSSKVTISFFKNIQKRIWDKVIEDCIHIIFISKFRNFISKFPNLLFIFFKVYYPSFFLIGLTIGSLLFHLISINKPQMIPLIYVQRKRKNSIWKNKKICVSKFQHFGKLKEGYLGILCTILVTFLCFGTSVRIKS